MIAKHILLAIALITGIFFSAYAHAESNNKCLTLVCHLDEISRKPLSSEEMRSMASATRAQLQSKAEELANVWGDTILEGDFYADGPIVIDRVVELSKDASLIGYYITYSSKAWDTSTCDFDPEDLSTLQSCETGRIVESSLVSADFLTFTRDSAASADFKKDLL